MKAPTPLLGMPIELSIDPFTSQTRGVGFPSRQPRVIVKHECKPGSEEVSESTTKDGTQIVSICRQRIYASARKGLEEARAEIAADKDIPEETRKQILRTLDVQISHWSSGKEG